MDPKTTIPFKILNHLRYGKTALGKVGAVVKPTGGYPDNQAWITVVMKNAVELVNGYPKPGFLNYEVEYMEFKAEYNEELYGYHWDLFLVRTETYHNIKDEWALEQILSKWLNDMSQLQPVARISHPCI